MRINTILLSIMILVVFSIGVRCQDNCFHNCLENWEKVDPNMPLDSVYMMRKGVMNNLIGCSLPEFTVESVNGEIINSSELQGKIVVLNFWFMTCAPCIAEIPGLNRLVEEYKNQDVVFLGFTSDDKETVKNKFLEKYQFDYKLIPIDSETIDDFCIYFGWPSNMVFDANGKLKMIFAGGKIDERAIEEVYSKLKIIIDECISDK